MSTVENQIADAVERTSDTPVVSTARYVRKKQAIIAAANEIINRDGVKGMTLSNVASSVGLITTSVTYYFKKKEDLAVACYREGIERFEVLVAGALQAGSPQARMERIIELSLDLRRQARRGDVAPIVVFNDIRALHESRRVIVAEMYKKFFASTCALFVAPELVWMDEKTRRARAHVLLEQLYWAVAWLPRYDVEDYDRIRQRMTDILLNGIAAPSMAWNPVALPLEGILRTGQERTQAETFLIAATRLINEQGYRGASVEKISARLNVTKGSFYHHNEAKDDLVVECFQRSFDTMRRVQRAFADQPLDDWTRLSSAAAALVSLQLSERGPLLRASALTALPESIRTQMIDGSNRISERFAATISDGIASGSMRAVDPSLAAQMLTAALNAASEVEWWTPGVQCEEAAALYAKPLLMGILSR